MRSVILERHGEKRREKLRDDERVASVICQFVAASAGHSDGMKAASRIRFVEPTEREKRQNLPSAEEIAAAFEGSARG